MSTNAKRSSRKSVGLDPPVSRTGTTRSKPRKTPESTADSSEIILSDTGPSDAGPSTEDIARLAYALWEARGGIGGSAEEDWYRAEQEVRTRS